jgi:AAA family ATP:ADP antiporter
MTVGTTDARGRGTMEPRLPSRARVAAIASAAMIAQQVAGKATRDALYLSNFSATTLPPVMGVSAVVSLFAALWLSRILMRYTPARVVPLGFGAGAAMLLAMWGLSFSAPRLAAVALYLYTALFGVALISAFWSLINETFDPHASRRAVTAIASGGTLGGLLGGLAAWRLSSVIAVTTMLPVLAAANTVCMWGTMRVGSPSAKRLAQSGAVDASPREPAFPLRVLREAPYLRNLAAIVALGAASSGLLDYVFSAEAAKTFAKGPALLSFFSMFWVVVGVLSFILQVVFGRFALEKLGLALNVALLPAIVLLGSAVGLAVPGLASTSLLRGGEATQRNSLFRAAYEMLYTPLPDGKKRAIKAVIDLGFDRLGTLAAAGLAGAAVWFAGPRAETALLGVAMACALVSLTRSRPLHLGYVSVLEDSLRRGVEAGALSVTIPPSAGLGVTRITRDKVADVLDVVLPPQPLAAQKLAAAELRARDETSAQDVADLTSTDVERARRALSVERPLARTAVAFAIQRLADKKLRDDAIRALRRTAPMIPGQLADALCDPGVESDIRRRIPRLLSECPTQQVADALLRGAQDERFEVRYECGRALLKITQANANIVIPPERVIAIVKLEVSLDRSVWESQPLPEFDDVGGEPVLIDRLLRDRLDRSLEHVFTLLALHLDRGSLVIAFKALHNGDERLRGTALEYLETVLPDEIRDAVWPYLGEQRPMRPARSALEILADLERSVAGGLRGTHRADSVGNEEPGPDPARPGPLDPQRSGGG